MKRLLAATLFLAVAIVVARSVGPAEIGPAETRLPTAPVWGDLDGDNQPDQLFIEHSGNESLINFLLSGPRAGGRLSLTISASIVTAADVDGDGDLDLIAASPLGSEVWLNDGSGRFTAVGLRSGAGLSSTADRRPLAGGFVVAVSNPTPIALNQPEDTPRHVELARGLRNLAAELASASSPPSQPRAPPLLQGFAFSNC
jgi:hypothetical protein